MKGVCAVVGAGPGLGGAIASRFVSTSTLCSASILLTTVQASAGYSLFLLSRSQASVEETLQTILRNGGKASYVKCDGSNEESVREAFAKIGPVDVLVYNAASSAAGESILTLKKETVLDSVSTNAIGLLLTSQAVLPSMIGRNQFPFM
jgi:NAD(P)-dependent dehydrogenase (short-subunit alcohol dehydrogenase family)